MLESRLNTVRRRTSTVNFSSLISGKGIGGSGIQVKPRNLLTSQRKRNDNNSTKSEPLPKRVSVVRRQPSVMSVMRSMNPQNTQANSNPYNSNMNSNINPNMHSNMNQNMNQNVNQNSNINPNMHGGMPGGRLGSGNKSSNQSLSIGQQQTNKNQQRPMTMHGNQPPGRQDDNQKWLGRFEREFQQTKLQEIEAFCRNKVRT